ncbi:MAG TPA: GNAT family N-acetyltransferase [Allosphingosinicella sp.]|nr:GNAT family N-acetyltransferase [Allosphingosinicella sp.]
MNPILRRAAALGVTARPMTDDDLPFVAGLYRSVRAAELAQTGWPDDMLANFLDQQHRAQHQHYRAHYPDADWLILERDGEPIGRLYVDEAPSDLHLIDISLLEDFRGAGIGRAIMADLIERAGEAGQSMSLFVEPGNPARNLYLGLGFVDEGNAGAYEAMRWRAGET